MDNIKLEEKLDRIENLLLSSKKVLTLEEACDYTGISRSYLYKLTSAGIIPHSKPNGKMIFFDIDRLNEWLLRNDRKSKCEIKNQAQNDIMEIIEDRHARKSTIIVSQLPVAAWFDIFPEQTIADAILDRIVHTAHRFNLKGESLRKKVTLSC